MLDPHGRVALMLCEALVHALVEERVLTKGKALSVIETVVDLRREIAETDTSRHWPNRGGPRRGVHRPRALRCSTFRRRDRVYVCP